MDFNDDGILDIIVGDRDGFVNYFRGTGVATLTTEPDIKANETTIDAGANSAPVVVDWNEDGLLDLVLGTETGTIRLYLNSGTPSAHQFTTYTLLQSGGSNISWYRGCPQVYDLNEDGRKDLIVGENNAKLAYYENTGTNAAPVFSGYEYLESAGSDIDLYYGTRLWVADANGDGLTDLMVSDFEGWVYLFPGLPTGVEEGASGPIQPNDDLVIAGTPSTGCFSVQLSVHSGADVSISIYSATGRLVSEEGMGYRDAGTHTFDMNIGGEPSGIYFVQARMGGMALNDRMVLLP